MSDEKSGGQGAAMVLEAGIEKLISIANKAIAGGAPTHFALAMLESNLILILRATAKAADISGEEIRGLRDENRAMLELLRRREWGPDAGFCEECGYHGAPGLGHGPGCAWGALLNKHGRSP